MSRLRLLNPAECVSSENNGQSKEDNRDRHQGRTGDVSQQNEEDRDDGEDCCDVVLHNFLSWGFPEAII